MTNWNKELPAESSDVEDDADTLPSAPSFPGEGDVAADRRYRAGVARTIAEEDVAALAERAREALEGPEGDELREAEERARAGEHPRV